MATPVEQIKERLSILDVVGGYVQLQKAGRHFKGKSPFTNEKTPSFFVSPERNMYYCFSSGKGGDIFTFIQEVEGVDFKGALKILAERAHIELVPENPQKRSERETLYALLDTAATYFADTLRGHPDIHAYLAQRGVSDQSIAKWRIGYIPDQWRLLKDHLAQRGFSEAMMLRSGLVKRSEEGNTLYDVFRGRVLFPIADASGRVVAFSGRTMSTDPALPKYVNSPETELYEKSHTLFGYDKAKQGIRTYDFSLIVEGQFDLVLAHQAGFTNTVAISGTALSQQHVSLLERLSKRVVLALDADRAGINSVKRSAEILLGRGMDVKVARMQEGKDPADLVAEDPGLLKHAVRDAETVIEFLIAVLKAEARDLRAFKLRVRDEVLPFVARIPDRIDREHFEAVVSEALSTTKDAVHYEVERIIHDAVAAPRAPTATTAEKQAAPPVPTRASRTDELARFVLGILLWHEHDAGSASSSIAQEAPALRAVLKTALGDDAWRTISDLSAEEENKLMFEAERYCADMREAALLAHVHSCIREIEGRSLKYALGVARAKLVDAEAAGDDALVTKCLAECAALQRRLSDLSQRSTPS